jgi:hypothetical protein
VLDRVGFHRASAKLVLLKLRRVPRYLIGPPGFPNNASLIHI